MAGTSYIRQSTLTDGNTITAALFNDEYNKLVSAFTYSSTGTTGHRHDSSAGEGGNIFKIGDQDFLNKIEADSTNNRWGFYVQVSSGTVEQIRIQDGAIVPVTDSDVDLGTSSLYFKNAYIDSITTTGNVAVGGNLTVTGTTTFNGGTLTLGDAAGDNVVFGADVNSNIIPNTDSAFDLGSSSQEWRDLYLDGTAHIDTLKTDAFFINGTAVSSTAAELNILDGVTSTAAELNILDGVTSTAAELNALDGITAVVGELNALDIGSTAIGTAVASKAVILDSNKDYTGIRNLTLTGDLTIGGDDLIMGTNTTGALLIADGTNFNPTTISSLTEISTAATEDTFLAIDASGGGLKKITRGTIIAGTGSSGDLASIVEDTSPQLGGSLDVNGQDIVTTSNATLDLAPNGTGTVVVRGNTNSGAIVFNCESNSHGQKVFGQPHSASVTNALMLPAGANSTLVSLVSVDTLTNKTLTSPKINEDVAVTSTATEINILDGVTSTTAELNILDGVTSTAAELNILDGATVVVAEVNFLDLGSTAVGTAIASKAVILDSNKDYTGVRNLTISGELDAATLDISGAIDVAGNSVLASVDVTGVATATTFEPDGDTAAGDNAAIGYTAAEGLILTGQGSTNDVTIKNDADADVIEIPTGTVNVTMAGTVTAASTLVGNAGLHVKNGATGAGFVQFFEDSDNGTNKVTLVGPASTADITLTLPSSAGSSGQSMVTDGNGVLSFATVGGLYNDWAIKTSAYTMVSGDQIIVNASGATTITVPASASAGDTLTIKATGGGTVTIGRNSQKINSTAADGTLTTGKSTQLVFVNSTIGFLEL